MTLAIVAALHQELTPLLADAQAGWQARQCAGRTFWCGQRHGQPLVVGLSRVGKVAAATTATALIERFGVQGIVFTGVAGGLAPDVGVGDIVIGSAYVQHDMDARPLFARYEVPLYGRSQFAADAGLLQQLQRAAGRVLSQPHQVLEHGILQELGVAAPRLHVGLIASGDRFVSSTVESLALQAALPEALAVEMEGAAFAQVCADYGVPFVAVRTISDRADDAAHGDFNRFIEQVAARYSAAVLEAWLQERAQGQPDAPGMKASA